MKMIQKINKILLCGIFAISFLIGNFINIQAASFSISTSKSSVQPGQSFTVTVTGNDCVGRVDFVASNGTLSSSSVWVENNSASVTVTAGSSGTVSVTATPATGFSDGNGDPYNPGSRSVSVSIKQPQSSSSSSSSSSGSSSSSSSGSSKPATTTPAQEPEQDTRSKNYKLSSLSVDQGTLSPKFDAEVTSYKVSLPKDAAEITVSAKAEDSKAKVTGTGKKELKAGDNKIQVTCTSEYGTKQVYTINVYVDEEPLVYLDHDGASLGVVRNTEDVKVLDGFKESKVKVGDEEIAAWTNETMNQTIVYLIDEEDNKGFYLFEDGKVISSIKEISIAGRTLYQIDIPKEKQSISNMKFGTVMIKDLEIPGWTYENKDLSTFIVVYVMNEKGEQAYYQYDSKEETLQLFNGLTVDDDAYHQAKNLQYAGFGVAGVAIAALVGLGAWLFIKQKKQH